MFETSVVQARAKAAARRPLLFSLSIGAHVAAVVGVVTMSVASVTLPTRAPHQVSIPVFRDLKPMLGDGSPKPRVERAVTQPEAPRKPLINTATMAPNNVPDHIAQVPAQTADTGPIGDAAGPATSGPTGPGVPWGSKDGVVPDGPPTTAPSTKIYTPGDGVKQPIVLSRVSPPYPELARRMRREGFVILECIIDRTGRIREAHVLRSSFAAFEQPALDAVNQWQFAPGTMNGVPVDVQFDLTVTFKLN